MRRVALLLLAACALSSACTPRVAIPDDERARASRELEGQRWFLKVAANVAPFFGDGARLLITDQPVDEVDLVQSPDGAPMPPRAVLRVLPPGTSLRVERVEFPTRWAIADRVLMTPRYHPWVYLALAGEERPLVMVLPQDVASADDARVEVGRLLGPSDPRPQLEALPETQRTAIGRKQLLAGMTPAAIEMAWGYPEKKVIERPAVGASSEAWTWPGGRRSAWLENGRLTRWEQR